MTFPQHTRLRCFHMSTHRSWTYTASVADLGFGKSGCPIRQKGAPEGAKPWHAPTRAGGGPGGLPQKIWKSRHPVINFPGISGHYKLCDWVCFYDVSGVDFAGDTVSIVHRDRKVEVAPNWATVYFQKGQPKQRAGVRTPWTPSLDPPLMPRLQWSRD